jgi:MFS family permease
MTTRPILLLEAATLLSGTGNGVASVALPWLILERTGSAVAAGIVAAATALPLLVSSLFSGTLVDIVGRRRMAITADLLSAIAVALIPVVDRTIGLDVWSLVALAILGAVFDPAGLTARETMLPAAATTANWRLDRANGVHEAVWGAAFLIGPGIGGVLIASVGAVTTLWVTAAGFVLSAFLLLFIRLASAGSPHADRPSGIWQGTREGLSFVWHDRTLRTVALVTMALVALYLPVEGVVLPVHFQELGSPGRLGALVMAMSAGGVAGALAYGAVGNRVGRRLVFSIALVGTGVALLGLAFLPPYGVMVTLAVATGFMYGPVNPLVNYAMQTRTPEHLRGRVVGVITSSAYAAGPVGYLLAGPLVQWLGVRPTLLVMSGLFLAVTLLVIPSQPLRDLDAPPAYPPSPPEPGHHDDSFGPLPLGEHAIPAPPATSGPDPA